MAYELQLRSTRYPADPEQLCTEIAPGRPLAEDIAAALRERGYDRVRVINDSPLWLVEVTVAPLRLNIIITAFEAHEVPQKALWVAYLSSARGLWARLRRQPENPAVLALANALDAAVRAIDGVAVVGREGDWNK